MLEKITIEDTIKFNSIARAILSHESVSFLYDHIRRNKKLAIEVTVDEKHLIGFIDLEELVHVNINKIRTVVPLTQFNEFTFIMNCGAYSSAFEEKIESKKSLNSKKNISLKKIQNFANDTQAVTSEILYNSEGNPMFVILEIELQKPLNEEVFLEIDMFRHPDNSISSFKQVVKCQLKENIRNKIKFQTKNLLKIYEQEGDLENIFNTTVNNGYVGKIVDSLMVDIYELAKDQFNSSTSNNNNNNNGHLLSTLMCEMKSTVLNEPKIESDHHTNKLLAKIYYELNIKDRSNDIFLKRLLNENFSEASWISYGIHNLRSQKFNEANVCFEESLQINNRSLLG